MIFSLLEIGSTGLVAGNAAVALLAVLCLMLCLFVLKIIIILVVIRPLILSHRRHHSPRQLAQLSVHIQKTKQNRCDTASPSNQKASHAINTRTLHTALHASSFTATINLL